MSLCFSYRRYFGTIIPHQKAAVFTARRAEMVEVMDQTLHFLNRQAMVRIYSPYSDVPRHVSIIMTIRLALSECFCYVFAMFRFSICFVWFGERSRGLMNFCLYIEWVFFWLFRTSSSTTCPGSVCSTSSVKTIPSFLLEPSGSTPIRLLSTSQTTWSPFRTRDKIFFKRNSIIKKIMNTYRTII